MDASLRADYKRNAQLESLFRGQIDPPVLEVPTGVDGRRTPRSVFIYESLMRVWVSSLDTIGSNSERSSASGKWPVLGLFDHLDFFLPLCLKSIALRYQGLVARRPIKTKVILDDAHHALLGSFLELLAKNFVNCAASTTTNRVDDMQSVSDFFIGLSAMIHSEFLCSLMKRFLNVLQSTDSTAKENQDESMLRTALNVMKMRLVFLERLAAMPSFLALNYPPKYNGTRLVLGESNVSWLSQFHVDQTGIVTDLNFNSADSCLPPSGWLGKIVVEALFEICSRSLKLRPNNGDVIRNGGISDLGDGFGLLASHASATAYQLVVRKNAMDSRFQTDSAKCRVAALFTTPILDSSVKYFSVLSKLDSKHPARNAWLLSVVYVLQEAPEVLISYFVAWCCGEKVCSRNFVTRLFTHLPTLQGTKRLPRFIKLLALCAATFHPPMSSSDFPATIFPTEGNELEPWLRQECFNTIGAAANSVVDICKPLLASRPDELKTMMKCVSGLFLQMLALPQSAVTCSRIVGGALQTLESNTSLFVECIGSDLQHWARVLYSTMNSVSLSVRSIAVDFLVSLFGGLFIENGNIDAPVTIFSSVLPECVAREVAIYSTHGHVKSKVDIEKAVWPLRRSIADLEDANPVDDDRVDAQLAPAISLFGRTNQAIIDGVLLEMELNKEIQIPLPSNAHSNPGKAKRVFDADEESLFEAANFFKPEVAPLQRIRWFMALSNLQETKQNYVEAAEASFLIALTICDAIPHANQVWRPSRFSQWSEPNYFAWEPNNVQAKTSSVVVSFASRYLEPESFLNVNLSTTGGTKLAQPTVSALCSLLTRASRETVRLYLLERGMEQLAYNRLELLLKILMRVIENHESHQVISAARTSQYSLRKRYAQEEASLRGVIAGISAEMTKLAEILVSLVEEDEGPGAFQMSSSISKRSDDQQQPCYVIIRLYGTKPAGFLESTTIPPFIVWEKPCVCRISESCARGKSGREAAVDFATPLFMELQEICDKVEMRTSENFLCEDGVTYIDVLPVSAIDRDPFDVSLSSSGSKRFFHKRDGVMVETTVAFSFPCALSRQSSLLTTEISSAKAAASLP